MISKIVLFRSQFTNPLFSVSSRRLYATAGAKGKISSSADDYSAFEDHQAYTPTKKIVFNKGRATIFH